MKMGSVYKSLFYLCDLRKGIFLLSSITHTFLFCCCCSLLKNPPEVQETQVWSLGQVPTPMFLPGEFHRQRSLVGYSLCGHKVSDMTEWLTHTRCEIDSKSVNQNLIWRNQGNLLLKELNYIVQELEHRWLNK